MKKILFAILTANALLIPMAGMALDATDAFKIGKESGSATERLLGIVDRIKTFAVGILIALATLFILYAAFLYVTAGAEPKHISQAKDIILYAVIAIVIALLSQVIVGTVTYVLTGHF